MSHLSMHDIDQMSMEQMPRRLEELREELLQLRAQQALGGSSSTQGNSNRLGGVSLDSDEH